MYGHCRSKCCYFFGEVSARFSSHSGVLCRSSFRFGSEIHFLFYSLSFFFFF